MTMTKFFVHFRCIIIEVKRTVLSCELRVLRISPNKTTCHLEVVNRFGPNQEKGEDFQSHLLSK